MQVTVVHVNATCKNAADDKLRQSLRRFADAYPPPATVLLLSGETMNMMNWKKFTQVLNFPFTVLDSHSILTREPTSYNRVTVKWLR